MFILIYHNSESVYILAGVFAKRTWRTNWEMVLFTAEKSKAEQCRIDSSYCVFFLFFYFWYNTIKQNKPSFIGKFIWAKKLCLWFLDCIFLIACTKFGDKYFINSIPFKNDEFIWPLTSSAHVYLRNFTS